MDNIDRLLIVMMLMNDDCNCQEENVAVDRDDLQRSVINNITQWKILSPSPNNAYISVIAVSTTLFIYLFVYLFVRLSVYLFIYYFIHSCYIRILTSFVIRRLFLGGFRFYFAKVAFESRKFSENTSSLH